jgi:formate-dependent phosphoribosylglycinamide formyltransferase (GAR transformylase)
MRVRQLYQVLQQLGARQGTILEIGSLCGSFALILQRLGYQVTAVDRYQSYGAGFQAAVDLMSGQASK